MSSYGLKMTVQWVETCSQTFIQYITISYVSGINIYFVVNKNLTDISITNSKEQILPWNVNSHSASQNISHFHGISMFFLFVSSQDTLWNITAYWNFRVRSFYLQDCADTIYCVVTYPVLNFPVFFYWPTLHNGGVAKNWVASEQ